jgi:glycosyltransferase involved in cell wall biosynthesis
MRLTVYSEATSVGGAETVLGHLLAELDPGIEVSVLAVDQTVAEALASRRPAARATLLRAPGGKADVRAMAQHLRALRRQRPEIVQVNLQTPWVGQHGILAGLLGGYPVLAVEHLPFPSHSRLQRSTRRALCSRLAAHVAVGERAARRTEEVIGLRPGSVETIHNGVPDLRLNPVPRRAGGPTVGAIGRFTPQKGLDLLVRALARLPADVTCVLVGDGPERGNLERLAEELEVRERVALTGWVERPRDYLAAIDVVAMPSRFEGLPLVAIEAALAERPVVATAVDGIQEAIVGGATGILVPPEDPVALGEAISALLRDQSMREQMGVRARAQALERFSVTGMARSYEELYRRLLSGPGSSDPGSGGRSS